MLQKILTFQQIVWMPLIILIIQTKFLNLYLAKILNFFLQNHFFHSIKNIVFLN